MRTLIIILIISSFLQSTILPLDLVLIILICRSYIRADKNNLFLAFGFGILDSQLSLITLGFISILYLILVQATQVLSKTRITSNSLLVIPIIFALLFFHQIAISNFTHQSPEFLKIFLESLLSLPIFYIVRFWEERFVIRKEIKLRV